MKQKLVTMNLQNKAVTLLAAILFLILGLNTAVLTGVASRKYKKAMLTKSSLIGEGIQKELGKAVNLGIPVESLEGVNEKLAGLVSGDKGIGYAMVMDTKGKILFHDKRDPVGKEMKDDIKLDAISVDTLQSKKGKSGSQVPSQTSMTIAFTMSYRGKKNDHTGDMAGPPKTVGRRGALQANSRTLTTADEWPSQGHSLSRICSLGLISPGAVECI